MTFKLVHLYPHEMNIYGDRGNILSLIKRLEWRGIAVEVESVGLGDSYDFTQADFVFGGGGQDRGQFMVAEDLKMRAENLQNAAEEGVVMLMICGMYQLFGYNFVTNINEEITGVGIFKMHTIASNQRLIGNVVAETKFGKLVGFENHSGQTFLETGQQALGKVLKGSGNNRDSKQEGAVYKNVFGSYLHGPLLPKNPQFVDELLKRALARKHRHLTPSLDDELEYKAAIQAAARP